MIFLQLVPNDTYIAYLPLAHIFEISVELTCIAKGMKIGYSSPLTITDKSTAMPLGGKGDATLLRPHLMCAVPLVLDRIRKNVLENASRKGALFRRFLEFAISYKLRWTKWGFNTPLLNRVVFSKTRAVIGGRVSLSRTRRFLGNYFPPLIVVVIFMLFDLSPSSKFIAVYQNFLFTRTFLQDILLALTD